MTIQEKVNQYLVDKNEEGKLEHTPLGENEYYATQALVCPDQLQYKREHPEEHDVATLSVFMLGNMLHDFIQHNILTDYTHEVRIQHHVDDITIRGRMDAENDTEIIEIKSAARIPDKPLDHHLAQLSIYMKERNKPGRLVYVEKNSGRVVEYPVEWKDVADVYAKAILIFKQKTGCIPSWQCHVSREGRAYCPHTECPHNEANKEKLAAVQHRKRKPLK